MKVAIVFVALAGIVLVSGEPPVPSNQYLPSNQYGAPSQSYSPPSNSYGAPSRNYGAPSQTTAVIRPNNQYGAPSARPTNNYVPPTGGGYSGGGGSGGYSGVGGSGGYSVGGGGGYGGGGGGYGGGGGGGGYDDQSEPANYNFKYDVQDAASGNDFGHEESRQGDVARGKYYVLLPDGRRQVVEYVADSEGYKPKISYEQVGGGYGGGGGYSGGGYSGGGGYQGGQGGYQGGQGGYQGGNGGYQY